ncbi:LCP family protein [Streptomyces sp. NPDC048644]|uniref:LCP family protein n=1 Tax=Streptomyces sp. NPDC048644 TaxID=3365582 RepID=UPI00370FB28C
MDAQGRGRAGDNVDPADQWVLNPETGNYELRLGPAGGAAAPPSARKAPGPGDGRPPAGTGGDTDTRELPTQRDRRSGRAAGAAPAAGSGADGGRPAGGRAAARKAGRTASAAAEGPASRRKPKPKKSGKKKALYWTSGVLGFVLVAGGGGAFYLYQQLDGNISKVDVGIQNDAVTDGPVNILILGTDARSGKGNQGYGDSGSVGHADTTILMHVSKDRTNATALSIPRDMVTDIPNCPTKQKDGSTKDIPGQQGVLFNTSLGQEGRDPGCTWRTVEKLTGVKINHFMMADFNAVKELSEAVDGVEVCAGKDINDPKSHLKLSAGRHIVKGEQALAFVRTRHTVGFGSDLSRIELQQQFLSSMIRKMKSDAFSSPAKLYDISQAATKALTVDTGIGSAKKLVDLADDLKKVDIDKITFATVPVLDNPANKNNVILDKAKADPLFRMVQADHTLAKPKGKSKGKKTAPVKKAPPELVRVDVTNGGGPFGAAQETVDWLQNTKAAKLSTNAGNAPAKLAATRLEFAPNQADQAATLADWMGLPKSALKKASADAGDRVPMKLTLGKDFKEAGTPIEAPTETPDGVQHVNADDKNICAK